MKTLKATTIILLVICSSSLIATKAGAQNKSSLEVLEIKPEPIRQGRNVISLKVRNISHEDQACDIDIRTEAATGNWQTQFPHVIPGRSTQWIRHAYKIDGFITQGLRIRLRFYTAGTGTDARGRKTKHCFKEVAYSADDLEHAEADESELKPATEDQRTDITRALRKFQDCVRNREYEAAW
ncbi:MAG: hypothetical protein JSW59_16535, partial [Phycisphaerales bacterium]